MALQPHQAHIGSEVNNRNGGPLMSSGANEGRALSPFMIYQPY
jgi:hypothetical protein